MSSRHVRHVGRVSVRELIAAGALPQLEVELLKELYTKFRWGKEEKELLLDLTTDVLQVTQGHMTVEVHLRSLTQSRGVTVDYLSYEERFNVKKCILLIGDLGRAPQPWAQLIQPAVYFFKKECNVFWIEVPSFASSDESWLKFGTGIVRGALQFLRIDKTSVVACGAGGVLLTQVLQATPELLNKTHFVFNLDLPRTCRGQPMPTMELEEYMKSEDLQLWFAYNDDPPIFDRRRDGTAQRAFNAASKLQARMEGLWRRIRQVRTYDNVLISDNVNRPPLIEHASKVAGSQKNSFHKFSEPFLASIYDFLANDPTTFQDGMVQGLVSVYVALAAAAEAKGGRAPREAPELPALRCLRLSATQEERTKRAEENRRRLESVQAAASLCFAPPKPLPAALPATPGSVTPERRLATPGRRLSTSSSETDLVSRATLKYLDDTFWEGAKAGPGSLVALLGSAADRQEYRRLWDELHDMSGID